MAVSWPRPENHQEGDSGFPSLINTMEEALNNIAVGTGFRDVAGLLTNGWTAAGFHVRRRMGTLDIFIYNLDGTNAVDSQIIALGNSWAPPPLAPTSVWFDLPTYRQSQSVSPGVRIDPGGRLSSPARQDQMRVLVSIPGASWGSLAPPYPGVESTAF